MLVDLRLGRWEDVLANESTDAEICDPPYGSRTHASKPQRSDKYERSGAGYDPGGLVPGYAGWTADDVHAFVARRSPHVRGWMVALTSHDLIPAWEEAYERAGRYAFAPIACVMTGMSVRLLGDGPSNWTVYAMAARPRSKAFMSWGTLPGAYTGPRADEAGGGRGKPGWLMQALIRDYTRPGDVVSDCFAGWGATLAAAEALGRRVIGAEMDPAAHAEATRRLTRPLQVDLFGGAA